MNLTYKDFEPVIKDIYDKRVKLPKEQITGNNEILIKVLQEVVANLKKENALFNCLYTECHFGGSYYDNLKVTNPDEYDIDLKFQLPRACKNPNLEPSLEFPGFVSVEVDMTEIMTRPNLEPYRVLNEILVGDDDSKRKLDARKLRRWFESISDIVKVPLDLKIKKTGPAFTLKIRKYGYVFDVDLVPCFNFNRAFWPKAFRQYNSEDNFFIVPKFPCDENSDLWRLSAQIQESGMINHLKQFKPTLKLLKVLRNNERVFHPIKSYFIKTIFLWKLEEEPDYFEKTDNLAQCFLEMLQYLYEKIGSENVKYYWYPEFNLFVNSDIYQFQVTNRFRNIISKIKRSSDPKILWKFYGGIPPIEQIEQIVSASWGWNSSEPSDEHNDVATVSSRGYTNFNDISRSDEDGNLQIVRRRGTAQTQEDSTDWGLIAGIATIGIGIVAGIGLIAGTRQNRGNN